MLKFASRLALAVAVGLPLVAAPAGAQGITKPKQGKGGSAVQGSAGTDGSSGDSGLEHCDKPMGALAVVEPQDHVLASLRRYNLQSPVGLIRLMIQQSNCFIVVERGVGMQNMMQERALASAGEIAAELQHGRRPDGLCGLRAHAVGGVLREQRGRRRRRGWRLVRPQRAGRERGRRRVEVQGSADQHARGRRPQQRAGGGGGRQHQESRHPARRRRCLAAAAARPPAATAIPTKARSSRRRSWTTTTASFEACATIRACSATSARSNRRPRRAARPRPARCSTRATS